MSLVFSRRALLAMTGTSSLGLWACNRRSPVETIPDAAVGSGGWTEKASDLITLTDRPPNLEMPSRYLAHDLTPNDAMFVRWHLSGIPTKVDLRTHRLAIKGHVDRELSLSLAEIKSFPEVSMVAVNQCSG